MNSLPEEVNLNIQSYMSENDIIKLSITCKFQYWKLWDLVGCYTIQLYDEPIDYLLLEIEHNNNKRYKELEKIENKKYNEYNNYNHYNEYNKYF